MAQKASLLPGEQFSFVGYQEVVHAHLKCQKCYLQ